MKRPFPLRTINESVGALVLGACLAVLLLIVLTSRAQGWFEPELKVTIRLPEGSTFGLGAGSDVEVLGALAGSLKDIHIDPETEHVFTTALVRGDFRALVRGDSQVIVERKLGLAGDSYLSIIKGTKGVPLLPDAVLMASTKRGMVDGLEETLKEFSVNLLPAIGELRALLREATALTQEVRSPDGQVMGLVARLDQLTSAAAGGEGIVGRALTDKAWADEIQGAVTEANSLLVNIQGLASSADGITQELSGLLADLRQEIPQLLERSRGLITTAEDVLGGGAALLDGAQGVLSDVKATTEGLPGIASGVGDEVRDLSGMAAGVQESVREVERLMEALQRHWLLRGYVEPDVPGGRLSPAAMPGGGH